MKTELTPLQNHTRVVFKDLKKIKVPIQFYDDMTQFLDLLYTANKYMHKNNEIQNFCIYPSEVGFSFIHGTPKETCQKLADSFADFDL